MGNSTLVKSKSRFACVMAAMMLFVMLFSAFFIVSHSEHECTGEDCPVCACIQQCENILHGSGDSFGFFGFGIIPIVIIAGSILISYSVIILDTPVSSKVRMND